MVHDSGDLNSGDRYVYVNNRRLRCGHTTGTCAAAASKAAAIALLSGERLAEVPITLPDGSTMTLGVEDMRVSDGVASCAVRKDGGDDRDVTHGALVYAEVTVDASDGMVVDGGVGVGRVTKGGLDQPVGEAAINHVPRAMIEGALFDVSERHGRPGLRATISVPDGERLAGRTFNPRLGIEGGISILGTTGIVEPMSRAAIVETIRAEMSVRQAQGHDLVLVVPGNIGRRYVEEGLGLDTGAVVKCGNLIGVTLDIACELGFHGLLLVGNLGKLVKVAGGIMDTHSRNSDARMEILAANAIVSGADSSIAIDVMGCVTTDDALDVLHDSGDLRETMTTLTRRLSDHVERRTGGAIRTEVVVFSSKYGSLGESTGAQGMIEMMREDMT